MNTAMVPMNQIRRDSLEELPQRHARLHPGSLGRRDGGEDNARGNGERDGEGDDNGGGDGGGGGGGGGGNGGGGGMDNNDNNGESQKSDNNDDEPKDQKTFAPPPPPPSPPAAKASAAAPSTALISTTAATMTSTTPLETLISSLFPTTTAAVLPILTPSPSLPTSSQPRKGLNTDEPDFPPQLMSTSAVSSTVETRVTTVTSWTSVSAPAETEPTQTPTEVPKQNHHNDKHNNLSPAAERLLIGAGAIGAFIMIVGGIYLLTRMVKVDVLAFFRNRKFGKGGARGWYGWRKDESMDYTSDPPPEYEGYLPEEKQIADQQERKSFCPPASPSAGAPVTGAALERANSQRKEQEGRETLVGNPAPLGTSEATQAAPVSALEAFYNNTSTQNTLLSRQPSDGYGATSGTQNTFLTQQTSNLYDPNQRGVNHLSYLSSISSGFGDGLMIPEPVAQGQPRQTTRQSRKFSWMTSSRVPLNGPAGDRDTVYTTASIETAPRFRTVNSWVAQQAGRVQKQFTPAKEVPTVPSIPVKHQSGEHSRKPSEDPAFRQHPGEEVKISSGSRVPSAILNRKTGV